MGKKEFDSLGYLSRVFKGLSVEKKDHVLITARSLLRIQGNGTLCASAGKPVSHERARGASGMNV